MNNYVNTEKSLKRWLKSRVKITMATVVGFLIAGTAAFGMTQAEFDSKEEDVEYGKKFTTGQTTLENVKVNGDSIKNSKYMITVNGSETQLILDKDTVLSSNGENKYVLNITEGGKVTNNGKIIFNPSKPSFKTAVQLNGNGTAVEFTNNGEIESTGNAIEMTAGVELTNNGIIKGNITGENYKNKPGVDQTINLNTGSHIEGKIALNGTGTDTINITGVTGENGAAEELQSVTGADKINIKDGSNIKISAGSMTRAFTKEFDSFIAVENSTLENKMNLTENGTEFKKGSSLIQVYGKDGKNSKVINHGDLTVANGSQTIYANASNGSTVEIENYGTLTNNSENWSSAVNGKIEGNNSKISVVNNGTIITNNYGTGIDITVKEGMTGVTGEVINNGTITAPEGATYATGIQVEGASADVKVVNGASGTIEVGKGAGIFLNNDKATAENNGTITVTDKEGKAIAVKEGVTEVKAVNNGVVKAAYDTTGMSEGEIKNNLLGNTTTNNGIILNGDEVIEAVGDEWSTELTTTALNGMGKTIKITEGNTGTLIGNVDDPAKDKQFNLAKGIMKVTGDSAIENSTFAIVGTGKIDIAEGNLNLADVTINGTEAETAINVGKTLNLDRNNELAGNIAGTGAVNIIGGKTTFDGEFGTSALNIGKTKSQTEGYFTADSKFVAGTTVDATNGVLTIAVAEDQSNVLSNSTAGVTVKGNVGFDYSSLTKDTTLALGNVDVNHNLADAVAVNEKDSVYKVTIDDNTDTAKFEYNKELLADFGDELNAVNNGFQVINDKVSQVAKTNEERAILADKFYSSNIYSETVRAAYDNVKMNEEAVESLARKSEVGKWTAEGKALYSKNEYDRNGIVGDYSSEVESTGLMAAFGYGVNETTTAGIAFSGVKQDVDTDTGSADADLFYLGVYGNKAVGNYDFTAGLGYQFGEYEADNNILSGTGDKYDSQVISGYVQGRYTADLGDGLSIQPKVKLGYTYVEQDDAKDSYFGVEDGEVSTFDAEVGFDVVKSVQLEKSKLDVKFGASYIRTMGDTDEEFTGRFYGATASEGFNVLGAELAENVVKFNLGAEVTNENGFFYNGGLTYEFGSNDTEAYGVTAGVGYKF